MTAISKTSVKALFETGDRPTQANFGDLIDSYQDYSPVFTDIQTKVSAGSFGVLGVTSTTIGTVRSAGIVGYQLLSCQTTASAAGIIGVAGSAGTFGALLVQTNTTASAVNLLGAGTVGTSLFQATTTAQAQQRIGGTTVGIQVYTAPTTAAAQSLLGTVSTYVGSAQAMTAGGLLTFAHGLGAEPFNAVGILVNNTTEANWSPGDQQVASMESFNVSSGFAIYWDATNIYIRIGSAGRIALLDKTTGATTVMTLSNWRMGVRAWRQ